MDSPRKTADSKQVPFWLRPVEDLKPVAGYLAAHWKEDFSWRYYGGTLLFIGICILANYVGWEQRTGERWLISKTNGSEWGMLAYLAFYGVPYYLILLWQTWSEGEGQFWRKRDFWVRSLFGLGLLSFDAGFYYYYSAGGLVDNPQWRYFVMKCAGNMISAVAIFVPLWIWYRLMDRKTGHFYGLRWQGFDPKPYVWMLVLMVPLIAAASFLPDFLRAYPNFSPRRMAAIPDLPMWLGYAIFEPIYLIDYTWTEVIFRGFLVLGLVGVLGRHSVMPMVGVYAFRHFAKPLGETIGSIFGGWILGVIALRSRNIMGGVFLHIGVAALMDLFAGLQWWWR